MLKPAYKLTIGDRVVDTTDEPRVSTVVDLTVALDLGTPIDSLTLMLGRVGGLQPARDDEVTVELGYADNGGLTRVLSGTVALIEPGLTTTRVVAYSGAATLLRTFVDTTYEGLTAGAIVRELADEAGVDVALAEDGIAFPGYVVDGRRPVYSHMHDLADLCGHELYANAGGQLVFGKFVGGSTVHVFENGKHLLELELTRQPQLAGRVESWGESPAGAQGEDAWSWLTKDFSGSRGIAGSGTLLLLERAALRTADAARLAAEASLTAIQRRTLSGRLLSLGRPQVALGHAIRLRGLADDALNTSFQVRSVRHRITKQGGFTTTVGFRAIDA